MPSLLITHYSLTHKLFMLPKPVVLAINPFLHFGYYLCRKSNGFFFFLLLNYDLSLIFSFLSDYHEFSISFSFILPPSRLIHKYKNIKKKVKLYRILKYNKKKPNVLNLFRSGRESRDDK